MPEVVVGKPANQSMQIKLGKEKKKKKIVDPLINPSVYRLNYDQCVNDRFSTGRVLIRMMLEFR